MDSIAKANKLAEEMSRFEQEILGASEAAPKGPSAGPPPISTPNTSTPHMPLQFFPRPPGPPGFSGPPGPPRGLPRPPGPPGPPPGVPDRPGLRPQSALRPLLPPRPPGPPPGPPRFQMPPGPPMGPPPINRPPPRLPPPPPGGMPPQRPPMMATPPPIRPPPPQLSAVPISQPPPPPPPHPPHPPLQQHPPPHERPRVPQAMPPLAVPTAPPPHLMPSYHHQPPVAKPTRLPPPPPLIFPNATTSSSTKSAASRTAVEAEVDGAEGGVVEAGLLPVPKKPPRGFKTDATKLRMGGGQVWQDHSLEDWDPNDCRIFVGDLGNDVNDDLLARTFSKYPSFLKAKVIRDKWTKKTKGYGFVSFRDPQDFIQAMREMNGKHVGNRPMKLRKSMWKDRNFLEVKKKEKVKKRLGFK